MISHPPDKGDQYENDGSVEKLWAVQTFDYAETHMNLISSVDSRLLKLTQDDEVIHRKFKEDFSEFEVAEVSEDDLKSPKAKVRWRTFCNSFKGEVEHYNQGTLLRLNCSGDYSAENTILVTRVQFFAIEIARNRLGLNLPRWQCKRRGGDEAASEIEEKADTKS